MLPKNLENLIKLYFNLKFTSRLSYDRLAMHIFAVCLASFRPVTLEDMYESLNSAYLCQTVISATTKNKKSTNFIEKVTYNDIIDMINYLDGHFLTSSYYYDACTPQQPGLGNSNISILIFQCSCIPISVFIDNDNSMHLLHKA